LQFRPHGDVILVTRRMFGTTGEVPSGSGS
jgi:hypothetical protein